MLRKILGCTLILAAFGACAQTDAPPPVPRILTCNANSTTPGVVLNLRDAFNTTNSGAQINYVVAGNPPIHTFPNDSRPYWQAGVEKRAPVNMALYPVTGSDGTTGSRNVASSVPGTPGTGFYDPYPSLPAMDGNWIVMGNPATSNYANTGSQSQQIGMNGRNVQLNHNPNVMYYYKYTFTMDPLTDVNKFGITINNASYGTGMWNTDDRLKGIYINGQLISTTNNGGNLNAYSSTSAAYYIEIGIQNNQIVMPTNVAWAAAHPAAPPLWTHSGNNEIVFAVLNGGTTNVNDFSDANFAGGGMHTGESILKILDSSGTNCTPVVSAPVTAASQTSADALNFSGTVTNNIGATTVNVTVRDTSGAVVGVFPASIDSSGNYTFAGVGPSGLVPGNYSAASTLVDPANPSGPGFAVSGPTAFTVAAPVIQMNPPANIAAGSSNQITGVVQDKGAATTVDVVLKDAGGNTVGSFPGVPIQPDGSYAVPSTGNLPAGNYVAQATITGVSPSITKVTGTFSASAITVVPPPTITTTDSSTIAGNVQFPGTAKTAHVVVTGPDGKTVYEGDAALDASGQYTVPLNALPVAGSYSITATANGASATAKFDVVKTAVTVGPQPTVDSSQPSHIAGKVTNPGPAKTVDVKITDGTGKVVWQGTAPLNADGSYTVDSSVLPKGDYTVTASANGSSATTALKVTDPPTEVQVTSPGTLSPTQKPVIAGTVQFPGTATTVDLKITDGSGKTVWQGTATLNADGTYSTEAQLLPVGSYTVTATANGKSATTSFDVSAVPAAAPVPTLGQWSLMLLASIMAGLGMLRSRRLVRKQIE